MDDWLDWMDGGTVQDIEYGSTRGNGGTEVQIRVLTAVNARGEREIHSYRLSSLYPRYAHGFESKWGDEEEASCRRKGKGREGREGKLLDGWNAARLQ